MSDDFEEEDYSPSTPLIPGPAVPVTLKVPTVLAGSRLDQALATLLPAYSRSRLASMVKDGNILVDGHAAQPKLRLLGGEIVVATLKPRDEETAFTPENVPLQVVFEDDSIIVIDKPPGLVVHPAAGNWRGTILNGLLYRNPQVANLPRAGIVHRLDKDTSGVMVAAKSELAQTSLVRQLQARTMKRQYLALARGLIMKDGVVNASIGRHPRERTRMAVVGHSSGGKGAITHYRVIERYALHTLIECQLETGRTHQIRVHMQSVGFPLEGDPVYGPPLSEIDSNVRDAVKIFGRQALHARRLALDHPESGLPCQFEAPVPDDLQQLIDVVAAV
jgi:23S rRNA pseudouridine1911/1915/1917 synthase